MCQSTTMDALHFATDSDGIETGIECSWESVIAAIRRYAVVQPADESRSLNEWADLMEGVRQLRREF